MDITFILMLFLITLRKSGTPLLHKYLIKDLTSEEMILFMHFAYSIMFFIYFYIIFFFNKKKYHKFLEKWDKTTSKTFGIMIFIATIGILSGIAYYYLLKKYHVSYLLPNIEAVANILTVILAYLILKEKFTYKRVLGVIIVVIGLSFINSEL